MWMFTGSVIWMWTSIVLAIQMPGEGTGGGGPIEGDEASVSFAHCLRTGQARSVMACAGLSALNKLQSLQDEPSFNLVDGVTLIRDEQHPRGLGSFLDRDPSDFRGIFDSVGAMLSQRAFHWDMASVYPGLAMRVGPTHTGNGMLEFVLDPVRESLNPVKEASTGRILTRQLLVPFLLGFKFNLATIIPIVFGILVILAKKAVFISKLALVITSSLGLGSLLLGSQGGFGGGLGGGLGGIFGGSHGHGGGGTGFGYGGTTYGTRYTHPHHYNGDLDYLGKSPEEGMYTETRYRGQVSNAEIDPVTLGSRLEELYNRGEKKSVGRNFAWSEADNKAA